MTRVVGIIAGLVLLPLPVASAAWQADAALACAGDADTFVALAPDLDGQTDRWPLVATGYTYAAERIERRDMPGPWGRLLTVADGLETCFAGDPAKAGGEMVKMKADFDGLFPPARRKDLLARAQEG